MNSILECSVCGSFSKLHKLPNNWCPICFTFGSLFKNKNPTEEQLRELDELGDDEDAIY